MTDDIHPGLTVDLEKQQRDLAKHRERQQAMRGFPPVYPDEPDTGGLDLSAIGDAIAVHVEDAMHDGLGDWPAIRALAVTIGTGSTGGDPSPDTLRIALHAGNLSQRLLDLVRARDEVRAKLDRALPTGEEIERLAGEILENVDDVDVVRETRELAKDRLWVGTHVLARETIRVLHDPPSTQ